MNIVSRWWGYKVDSINILSASSSGNCILLHPKWSNSGCKEETLSVRTRGNEAEDEALTWYKHWYV